MKKKNEYLPLKFEPASEMRISRHIPEISFRHQNPKGTNLSLTMFQFLLSKTEYLICNIELSNYAARSAMFILEG